MQIPNSQMDALLLAVRVAMNVMEGTGPKYAATAREIDALYSHLADQARITLADENTWRQTLHRANVEAVGISNDFISGLVADQVIAKFGPGPQMIPAAQPQPRPAMTVPVVADETLTGKPEEPKKRGGGYSRAAYQRDMQAMYDRVSEKKTGVPEWDKGKNVGQNVVAFLGWLSKEYPKYFEGGRNLTVGKALRLWASSYGVETSVDKTNDVAKKYIEKHYPDAGIKKGRSSSA